MPTGDISRLQAYNATPCRNCDAILGIIGNVYAAGGRIEGAMWTPSTIKAIGKDGDAVLVALAVESAAGTTVPSSGADPIEFPADKKIVRFFVEPGGQVSAIEFLS